ncbi:MAG: response regulator transcription factor [bacterium]
MVEDDPDLSSLCARLLEKSGYRVDPVESGEEALEALERLPYALTLLDWHLPGLSGQALMEAIGWRWPDIPIIIMTGFSDENKAVAAVQYAQAYLRKPFENEVLRETVARVLHRSRASRSDTAYPAVGRGAGGPSRNDKVSPRQAGDVVINPMQCEASFGGQPPVALTATEYALLNRLFVDVGTAVSHKDLADPISPRSLSQKEAAALCKHHIRALRIKLEPDPADPRFILTVWGQGYRLEPTGPT